MSHPEFLSWREFYRRWPFDDFHRFHRPAALVAQSFGGGDMTEKLDWLQPITHAESEATSHVYTAADLATLKTFGFAIPTKKG